LAPAWKILLNRAEIHHSRPRVISQANYSMIGPSCPVCELAQIGSLRSLAQHLFPSWRV
jgi:hypothetical protein